MPPLRKRIASLKGVLPKMGLDALLFAVAYSVSFKARLETIEAPQLQTLLLTLPLVVVLKLAIFHYVGSYRSIWRYSSLTDLQELFRGSFFGCAGIVFLDFLLPEPLAIPRSIPLIDLALSIVLTGALRMSVRIVHESSSPFLRTLPLPARLIGVRSRANARRALVFGAGDAGEMMVREMLRSPRMDYEPLGFVDDDPSKRGQSIHGVLVLGGREDVPDLVQRLQIQEILIAMPSARGKTVRDLVQICRNTPANLKILPDLNKIVDGEVHLSDLRSVSVEDLLGREAAQLDLNLISSYVRGKRILVTGAGGSIGSELCRQILKFAPAEIQLMGRGENSIYEIHRELSRNARFTRLVQVIGDVINKKKLEGVFAMYRPQIVFHAGADKHVPLMELNPDEAVFNNIVGTRNVLEVANAYRAERVVCISTDKAVNPTSVMGCCKRVAELLVRSRLYPDTVAVAVRFGNVLGSRGSVIPHFQTQIRDGGPITVTHRDIKRYFMTIPEASGLVIQAGAMGKGREIFVLDMGEPVKIWDLATNMVRLAGLEPGRDIDIVETGLRPGEKMHEELLMESETHEPTGHAKITCVRGEGIDAMRLLTEIESLTAKAVRMDFGGIRQSLARLVPEYRVEEDLPPLLTAAGWEK
ncbi:MAG TPA: nucleoside-diphosphate sugar epimerase/dehydratase [Candidatus Polarisedimenticolaceae bacterium]|nr:nucleoside-diphosphate sugar epimerase/dehydratase [Candidatus Polarisedimenticolaceae bacterium]